jgi:hypothetical protein
MKEMRNPYYCEAHRGSSVVDTAETCTGIDFDGKPRPQGDACDLGADERAEMKDPGSRSRSS